MLTNTGWERKNEKELTCVWDRTRDLWLDSASAQTTKPWIPDKASLPIATVQDSCIWLCVCRSWMSLFPAVLHWCAHWNMPCLAGDIILCWQPAAREPARVQQALGPGPEGAEWVPRDQEDVLPQVLLPLRWRAAGDSLSDKGPHGRAASPQEMLWEHCKGIYLVMKYSLVSDGN